MGLSTALDSKSTGENINHYNAVRMSLRGEGLLLMTAFGLDDVTSFELMPFTMQTSTNIEPTRNMNFVEQRMALEIKTTEINEYFKINRIIIFSRELYTSYPDSV